LWEGHSPHRGRRRGKDAIVQALDEVEDIEAHADLVVDDTNLNTLLDQLDL
jgi:hypothetical protein